MGEYQKGRERGYELGKLTASDTVQAMADTIEALRAENAKLREALKGLMADYYAACRMSGYSDLDVHSLAAYKKARAAMGESDDLL